MADTALGALPSYQAAISRDPWPLIAPYVHDQDLFALSLVSRKIGEAATSQLWCQPASKFTLYDRSTIAGFSLFLECLRLASEPTRALTAYLDLTYRGSDLGADLDSGWLGTVFRLLPRLKGLSLDTSPFVDHWSLQALKSGAASELVFLSVKGCPNLTRVGIRVLLQACPSLCYLNVSRCSWSVVLAGLQASRDGTTLAHLRDLRCASVGLDDASASQLIAIFGTRLRTLDLSHNRVSSRFVDALLDECILPPPYILETDRSGTGPSKAASAAQQINGSANEVLDQVAANRSGDGTTVEMIGNLGSFRCDEGLTNLKLTGNRLPLQSIVQLLKTCRLKTLHVGSNAVSLRPRDAEVEANRSNLLAALSFYGGPVLESFEVDFACLYGYSSVGEGGIRLDAMARLQYLDLINAPYWLEKEQIQVLTAADGFPALLSQALVGDHRTRPRLGLPTLRIKFAASQGHKLSGRINQSSYTGNADGEVFTLAGQDDFSFFGKASERARDDNMDDIDNENFYQEIASFVTHLRQQNGPHLRWKVVLQI